MSQAIRTTIVLSDDRLQALKKMALEKRSSVTKLVNQALEKVFFKKKKPTDFRSLRGIWKDLKITDEDIEEARIKLKEFP